MTNARGEAAFWKQDFQAKNIYWHGGYMLNLNVDPTRNIYLFHERADGEAWDSRNAPGQPLEGNPLVGGAADLAFAEAVVRRHRGEPRGGPGTSPMNYRIREVMGMKNNEAWSDGPWWVQGEGSFRVLDANKDAVCLVRPPASVRSVGLANGAAEANARLISVAPELVEAARRCRADLAGYVDHPGDFSAAYIEAHQVAISVLDEHFQPLLDRARGVE